MCPINKVYHPPRLVEIGKALISGVQGLLIFSPVAGCRPNDLMSGAMTTCLTLRYFIHFINIALVAHTVLCLCVWIYTCSTRLEHNSTLFTILPKRPNRLKFEKTRCSGNISLRGYLINAFGGLNYPGVWLMLRIRLIVILQTARFKCQKTKLFFLYFIRCQHRIHHSIRAVLSNLITSVKCTNLHPRHITSITWASALASCHELILPRSIQVQIDWILTCEFARLTGVQPIWKSRWDWPLLK